MGPKGEREKEREREKGSEKERDSNINFIQYAIQDANQKK